MREEPTWFGPEERPLAGWLHVPTGGTARGGVLICPPVGLEYVNSHRALRTLAQQLADVGLLTLRFDYDGTGDSSGTMTDPSRIDAWIRSVTCAVDRLQLSVPGGPVAVVGLRMGATLAAHALASRPEAILSAVLWDPVVSGRQFFRQQAILGRLAGGDESTDGAVDAAGFRYEASTVAEAGALDLGVIAGTPPSRLLLLHRPGLESVLAKLGAAGDLASVEIVDGQPEFLDVPSPQALMPRAALARITGWLDGAFPDEQVACLADTTVTALIPVDDDRHVAEEFLRVGPLGLFAVRTAGPALEDAATPASTVVLLNNAVEHHVGPARMWTETARVWAAQGMTVVRIDLSGIGDSPPRPGLREDVMYAEHSVSDVEEFVRGLGLIPSEVVLVGLCSGAHLAIRAGAAIRVRSVIAVNPVTTGPLPPYEAGPAIHFGPRRAWPRKLLDRLRLHDVARSTAAAVRAALPRVPGAVWGLAATLHMSESPAAGLLQLQGVPALVVCGPEDAYGYVTRGKHDMQVLQRTGTVRFVRVEDLGHVPMAFRQRQALTQLLSGYLLEQGTTSDAGRPVHR